MKEKFLKLPPVQKLCVAIMALSIPVFAVLYLFAGRQSGAVYDGDLLFPTVQGEQTVYSGRAQGARSVFTVSPGPTVEYRRGSKTYGPYTIREDPAAVPPEYAGYGYTGVKVYDKGTLVFRGGWQGGSSLPLVDANGDWFPGPITYIIGGEAYDGDGNPIDPNEPGVAAILRFAFGPGLTHRGDWKGFWAGVLFAVAGMVSTFFADELFRLHLSWRVRDPYAADPSDWELFGRTIGAIAFVIFALVVQCMGLRAIV